jgi:ParB-like chromosome segregation protein Spo0J
MTTLNISYKKIQDLKPYKNNARKHSEAQIAQIAASMTEFGFNNPILLDGAGGIVAGHGRYEAALSLGLHTVPTIDLSHLTDAQKKAYIIADNKLAINAEWDDELLELEVQELKALDFDLTLLGFAPYELANMGGSHDEPVKEDEEQNPEINFTIQYNIIFEDEEQQADWYSFVKYLKDEYPDAETVAQRIQLFLRGNGYVAL